MNLTGFGRAVLEGKLQAWSHRHPLCLQKWILTESTTPVADELSLAAQVLRKHSQCLTSHSSHLTSSPRAALGSSQGSAAPSLAMPPWLLLQEGFSFCSMADDTA